LDENDREKDGTKKNEGEENNIIITGIGGIRGNIERGVKEWLERGIKVKVNVKEACKINKDKKERKKNRKLGAEEEDYAK
jgi:hypothetical protein